MADLIQLGLHDFRAFRKAAIDLPPSGVVLLAGPNNAGKSALLSGLDVVAAQEMPQAIRHIAGDQPKIWPRWRLNDHERIELLGTSPNTERLMEQGAASWLEWEYGEFHGGLQPIAFSVSWPGIERLEVGRITSNSDGSWRLEHANIQLATWDRQNKAQSAGQGGIQNTLHFLRNANFPTTAPDIIEQWRPGYFHFKPLRESRGRSWSVDAASPSLASNGSNLATVLLWLLTNEPDTWQHIASLVKQIVPGVGQLMVPVSGNQCSIVFQDELVPAYRHNLKDLGTGVEQLLMTLVLGLTQTATTVVMEEPETGLHPGAQRALLGLLQSWSKGRRFIASTHSATMLDWSSPITSVVAVSRTGVESTATMVTSDRAAVLSELGIRLSDVLSAEHILILEGPSDKDIFEVWFPNVIRDPRVAIIDGEGGYNAHHAELFVKWLESADQLGPRRVLYARDRDELSAKFLERLEGSPNVYVLPCRELENLLLDYDALAAVIGEEGGRSKQRPISTTEIESALRELAEQFKQIVILKRVMADLAEPIRLVDHKLRRELAKAVADHATLRARVLARLPTKKALQTGIAESWQRHHKEVEKAWDKDWKNPVPGADLLASLWQKFLGRGYGKATDGLMIAKQMRQPPAELAKVMTAFTSGS